GPASTGATGSTQPAGTPVAAGAQPPTGGGLAPASTVGPVGPPGPAPSGAAASLTPTDPPAATATAAAAATAVAAATAASSARPGVPGPALAEPVRVAAGVATPIALRTESGSMILQLSQIEADP